MEPPLLEAARGRREYFKYDLYDRRTQSVLATQADTSRYYVRHGRLAGAGGLRREGRGQTCPDHW